MRISNIYSGLLLLTVLSGQAGGVKSNVALQKSYTLSRPPTYKHTQDAGDLVQLTDGKRVLKNMWVSQEALGWTGYKPIHIDIDLGKNTEIDSVTIHSSTILEVGVSYPRNVFIFIGDDDISYKYMGDLIAGFVESKQGYEQKNFSKFNLGVDGKYVKLVVVPNGNFTYTDEVEVVAGAAIIQASAIVVSSNQVDDLVLTLREKAFDLQQIKREINRHISGELPTQDIDAWNNFLGEINGSSNNLQIQSLWEKSLSMHAGWLRKKGAESGIVLSSANPWTKEVNRFHVPIDWNRKYIMRLLGREHEPLAFWVTNTSMAKKSFRVGIKNLPDRDLGFTLRRPAEVRSIRGQLVLDALDPYDSQEWISLFPGESTQLWVDFYSKNGVQKIWDATIEIETGESELLAIQVAGEVLPVTVPSPHSFNGNLWAYPTFASIKNILTQVILDQKTHGINAFTVNSGTIQPPRQFPKNSGNFVWAFDDLNFFIRQVDDGKTIFLFYLGFNQKEYRDFFSPIEWMTPQWRKLAFQWVTDLKSNLVQVGIPFERWAMYPVDEIGEESSSQIFLEFAKFLESIEPKIRLYANPRGDIPVAILETMAPYVDIWQPKAPLLDNPERLSFFQRQTSVKWLFGFSRTVDPIISTKERKPMDYLLQPWHAFQKGFTGGGWWSYMDTGWGQQPGSARTDLDGKRPDFTVVYESKFGIVPSRRWEAYRNGVEDFEIFLIIQKYAEYLKTINPTEYEKAIIRLNEIIKTMVNVKTPEDSYIIARADLLTLLSQLNSQVISAHPNPPQGLRILPSAPH